MRRSAEAASGAIVIDPAAWGEYRAGRTPAHLAALQKAVVDGEQVRLGYADRAGNATDRVVHPLGLVAKGGVWYLVAGTAAGQRTFRVSRVRSVVTTGEPVERPDDFDLEAAWEGIAAEVDERRTPFRTRATVDRGVLDYLQWSFAKTLEVADDDGVSTRVTVELRSQSPFILAAQLAGLGGAVEVENVEVRRELARIGAELAELYAR
jgi:predicted DNA-binding transcriptional regulator YafY